MPKIKTKSGAKKRFRFTAKLWRGFTHEREAAPVAEDVDTFRAGIDPLAEQDRLLAVLVQFPWSFRNVPEERGRLGRILDAFGDREIELADDLLATGQAGTVGNSIFRSFVVPFEVVSMLLLAALIGAVAIARRD